MAKESTNPGKTHKQLSDLVTGLTDTPPAGVTSMAVNGKSYALADLIALLAGYAGIYLAAEKAEEAHRLALESRAAIEEDAEKLLQGTRGVVKTMVGKTSSTNTQYGITPNKKPAPLSPEKAVVKVAKAKATRAARHTMGKNQKKAITGQVPPDPTPSTTPSTTTPSTTPQTT